MEDSDGICLAVAAIWIQQRYLARKGGQPMRQAFKDFLVTSSGQRIASDLQDRHESARAAGVQAGGSEKEILAQKTKPAIDYVKKSGLGMSGATVCKDLRVMSEFICATQGYYLIAVHGSGGGHAFAVHHRSITEHAITLFDPNYGEVTWNFKDHYKKDFLAFFASLRSVIYQNELSGTMAIFRIGVSS
jgi:hypothetical protein